MARIQIRNEDGQATTNAAIKLNSTADYIMITLKTSNGTETTSTYAGLKSASFALCEMTTTYGNEET